MGFTTPLFRGPAVTQASKSRLTQRTNPSENLHMEIRHPATMKRFFALVLVLSAASLLQGCLGNGGSASSPPNTVSVQAEDSRVTLTWPVSPGVEYWIYKAAGTNVTPQSCSSMPECETFVNVTSPYVLFGIKYQLIDGETYSFSINGRTDGGPGGPGTPPVQATPQVAGGVWNVGGPVGSSDLRGVAYGTAYTTAATTNTIIYTNVYVAVGVNGALFISTNGKAWISLANPVPTATLNAVAFNGSLSRFVAVGANGVILMSADGMTWTQQASGTTNDLYSVTTSGSGGFIATGTNGTILISNDGVTWTAIPSGTTSTLYAVAYGTTSLGTPTYIAVGAAGTLLYSLDGVTWLPGSSGTTNTLYAVTNGLSNTTLGNVFVAVGDRGTVLYSEDGLAWALENQLSPASLNAVAFGRLFVAGDSAGDIYISADGANWRQTNQYTTSSIYAMARGGPYSSLGIYDYSAVGARGLNLYAE